MNAASRRLPRLPFGHAIAPLSDDVDAFTEEQRVAMPSVRWYEPLGDRRAFLHRSAHVSLGDMRLVASVSTPLSVSVGESRSPTLLVPFHGWNTSVIGKREFRWHAGTSAMFLSGAARTGGSGVRAMLGISFSPERLRATIEAVSGSRGTAVDLTTDRLVPIAGSRSPAMGYLRRVLPLVDLAGGDGTGLQILGVDDMLYRIVAAMLAPQAVAVGGSPGRNIRSVAGVRRAAEYIMDRLPDVIRLAELERISGLSARALQLAFRREYDCSPREWIRDQRLLAVRRRLLNARPQDTVALVALACGFTRLGSFAAAYGRRFGEKPSATLVRGRGRGS